jgi:hypothetical protein
MKHHFYTFFITLALFATSVAMSHDLSSFNDELHKDIDTMVDNEHLYEKSSRSRAPASVIESEEPISDIKPVHERIDRGMQGKPDSW